MAGWEWTAAKVIFSLELSVYNGHYLPNRVGGKIHDGPKKIARRSEGFTKFCLTGSFYASKGGFLSDRMFLG
jgi:hypothetical protein